jgi:hypothetical protein
VSEIAFYDSPAWLQLAERAKHRDGNACTVARLLGGRCRGVLQVHHIEPRRARPDLELALDNVGTVCAAHHPTWEAVRRYVERSRRPLPPCRHNHRYRAGRIECARRRAKQLGIVLDEEELERVA